MITIDELRKFGSVPRQGGMGVIKYRVGDRAWHFYNGEIHQVKNTGIHEHFNDFTSYILKGELKNYIYTVGKTDPNSTLQLIQQQSKINSKQVVIQDNITLVEMCTFSTVAGQSYYLEQTALHKIEMLAPKVVTYIEGDLSFSPRPLTYVSDTAFEPRPKNKPLSHAQCWEVMEDILQG